ncbi:MAG: hypothetical protein ABIP74_01935 [Candidatus Saccharimonas sp.]
MMKPILHKALALLVGDDVKVDELLKMPKKPTQRPFQEMTERELLTLESEIGAQIFGPIPAGVRREFFCLDDHTWIWHEEKMDKKNPQSNTIRYEINEHGVLKVQEGARYSYLEGEEFNNFAVAVRMYYEQVARRVYQRDPATGAKLA